MLTHAPRALYIHIPFCTNKCYYCDFTSYVLKGQPVDAYLDALEQEMIRTVELLPPEEIRTVFVGGGTPTVLTPPQMERFLSSVKRHFPIHADAEFTMEANPGTTDLEKLTAMRAGGVNRIALACSHLIMVCWSESDGFITWMTFIGASRMREQPASIISPSI